MESVGHAADAPASMGCMTAVNVVSGAETRAFLVTVRAGQRHVFTRPVYQRGAARTVVVVLVFLVIFRCFQLQQSGQAQ